MRHDSRVILIHYGEIALKGRNRPLFERVLIENIKAALKRNSVAFSAARKISGCLIVTGAADSAPAIAALQKVFGIVSIADAQAVPAEYAAIEQAVLAAAAGLDKPFRIEAHRSQKNFPLTSRELNERLGAAVQKATGAAVNLDNPGRTFFVDIVENQAYIYIAKHPGPGGLPVGTSGRVAVLLSGGIDSPVAAWYLAKRGCPLVLAHFHSYPYTSKQSQENVADLAKALDAWAPGAILYTVPLGEIQQRIIASPADAKYRVLLYRRAMVRLAQALAKKENARALGTGENIGQVASQTIENIAAVDSVAQLPILRPLLGFDKTEIIAKARTIGTYDISIRPAEDCCGFMVPAFPETKARVADLDRAEAQVEFGDTFDKALAGANRLTL